MALIAGGVGNISAWMRGLSRRQEATSNNIANIETPNYKASRVQFEDDLHRPTRLRGGAQR
mgnify:CR=1 FL=1